MSYTLQNVADLARETLNDSAKARYTDAALTKFGNAALGALCLLRPDLFETVAKLATVAGKAQQDIATADPLAIRLYDVMYVDAGDVLTRVDKHALDRFFPGWMTADADTPTDWMVSPEDPKQEAGTQYFLSPPPATGVQVWCKYVKSPAQLALADTVPVPEPYKGVLAHYIVFRAESKDDENVVEQRAAQAMLLFMQQIGMAKEAKVFMDNGRPQ